MTAKHRFEHVSFRPKVGMLTVIAVVSTLTFWQPWTLGTGQATSSVRRDLRVLLIGGGSGDPTTAAWQSRLGSEGVAYTLATASGSYGAETVSLPALTDPADPNHGLFNGVVLADAPAALAAGQLAGVESYETTFGVRQLDGYAYPNPALGETAVTGGDQSGIVPTLTPSGLAAFPALKGPVQFDAGTYGYPSAAGANFTSYLNNSSGQTMMGVYSHPVSTSDPQSGVAELILNFNYGPTFLQWLILSPGLIDWVTRSTHLGLYRNYFGEEVDDVFVNDNSWSSQYQCTPGATAPSDVTCPAGVANNPADTPPDLQMSASDVSYLTSWEAQTGIKLNLAFNAVGACTSSGSASNAQCSGSTKIKGTTYADPGHVTDPSYPDDAAFVNALLQNKSAFNWTNHTWSHLFLGCTIFSPMVLRSSTAGTGGSLAAGTYGYKLTAATSYGESEPSTPAQATVASSGSTTLTWSEATNGTGTNGTPGPTLATLRAQFSGGSGFWGYNVYRQNPGSSTYGFVGRVAEQAGATPSTTYSFTDAGAVAPGGGPSSSDTFPTATNPATQCSSASGSWLPDASTAPAPSIGREIGLNDAFAANNSLPNFSPAAVVTGEHSGLESPNMPQALANMNVSTFAADASRQPASYTLSAGGHTANSAPRYPSNIYYNAGNWPDEVNEYSTIYVASGTSLGNSQYPSETGHCTNTSSTTCVTTPPTEASILASESSIELGHLLNNDPRIGFAHQSNLIGPATRNGADYGYTLLTFLNNVLSRYNTWYTAPMAQVTDAIAAQTLSLQAGWAATSPTGKVTASEMNGVVTLTNSGTASATVPVTLPSGSTGASGLQSYGGTLSGWVTLPAGGTTSMGTPTSAPAFTSASSATATVGVAFSFNVSTTGSPAPAITETGSLPSGIVFTPGANGSAVLSGTPAAGTEGNYPIVLAATNSAGTVSQNFTLTVTPSAPVVTLSPTSLTFGATAVGSTSAAQSVKLTNSGSAGLSITGVTTSGDFSQTNNCPASLAVQASCNISVTFNPTASGTRTGTLSVQDNAAGSPQTVALSGTGGSPGATLNPTSLSFLNIIGSASAQITLTNSGTAPLSITQISISGDYYSQKNDCPSVLGIQATCTITVTWAPPLLALLVDGTLTVTDNAPNSPQTAALHGTSIL